MHADRERDGQRLAARLGEPLELPEVLAEREVDRRGVAALDHEPVVGAVPRLRGRVLGERDRGRDDRRRRRPRGGGSAAARTRSTSSPREDDFLHGARGHDARRDRLLHRAQVRLQRRVGRGADRQRRAAPRLACRLVSTGNVRALHVLEDAAPGRRFELALQLHDEGGDLVGGVDLLLHDDHIVGLHALDGVEERSGGPGPSASHPPARNDSRFVCAWISRRTPSSRAASCRSRSASSRIVIPRACHARKRRIARLMMSPNLSSSSGESRFRAKGLPTP